MKNVPVISVLLLIAQLASSQTAVGDWVFSDISTTAGGLFSLNPSTGAVSPIAYGRPTGFFNGVVMAHNNADSAALYAGGLFHLVHISPTGFLSTVSSIGSGQSPNGIDVDQDGSYLCSTSWDNGVYRVGPAPDSNTLLFTIPAILGTLNTLAIDQDTGHILVGVYNSSTADPTAGQVLRADRNSYALSTLAIGLRTISAVGHDTKTGNIVVTTHDPPHVRLIRPSGSVSTLVNDFGRRANGVKLMRETGDIMVAGENRIGTFMPNGEGLVTHTLPTKPIPYSITGIEEHASRKVSGSGRPSAGNRYNVQFSFPRSPGLQYAAALSMSPRPGIVLTDGTRRSIDLAPDLIFFLSVTGQLSPILTGFSGTLNADGRANGTVDILLGFPAGIRFYVSAVALNPTMPSGMETANAWGFTTE